MRPLLIILLGLFFGATSLATAQVRLAVTLPNPIPLVKRDRLYYQVNSQVPFTGTLTVMHKLVGAQPAKVAVVATFKAGKLDGRLKEYYRSGQLMHDWGYTAGKWQGLCKNYLSNGQVAAEASYIAGQSNGLTTCYESETGAKLHQVTFQNGQLSGRALTWRPRRNPSVTGYYIQGDIVADSGTFAADIAVGLWKHSINQDRGGPGVVFRGSFEQGKPSGEWTLSLGQAPPFAKVQCKDGTADPSSVVLISSKEGITLAQVRDILGTLHTNLGSSLVRQFKMSACGGGNLIFEAVMEYANTDLP